MELKKPILDGLAPSVDTNVRVLRIAPSNLSSTPSLASRKVWDGYIARLLFTLLAVALLLFLIAVLIPDLGSRFGLVPRLLATALLIGIAGVAARLMIRPVIALQRAAARVESGDLSARVVPGGSGETRQLGHTFNAMLDRLARMRFRLRGEVAESSATLAAAAQQLAAATQEQTTAATLTSASMEELSRSTVTIAETAAAVASQADDVRAKIASAQTEVQASGERLAALAHRVGEIEGILDLINDIADQTNLLALNAAIEAARAGETGRGFAVVADEVRRLAERSKAAAAQIAELVEDAQVQSQQTVQAVDNRGRQMGLWLAMMGTMVEASGRVQVATQQQRSTVSQVVLAIEHIAESSRLVATTAREIASASARQGELSADLASSTDDSGSRGEVS